MVSDYILFADGIATYTIPNTLIDFCKTLDGKSVHEYIESFSTHLAAVDKELTSRLPTASDIVKYGIPLCPKPLCGGMLTGNRWWNGVYDGGLKLSSIDMLRMKYHTLLAFISSVSTCKTVSVKEIMWNNC